MFGAEKIKITAEVRTPFHPFNLHHHFFIHARFDLSLFSSWSYHTLVNLRSILVIISF